MRQEGKEKKRAPRDKSSWLRLGALALAGAMVIGIVASVILSFSY